MILVSHANLGNYWPPKISKSKYYYSPRNLTAVKANECYKRKARTLYIGNYIFQFIYGRKQPLGSKFDLSLTTNQPT